MSKRISVICILCACVLNLIPYNCIIATDIVTVNFTSSPSGGLVTVDGKPMGVTPISIKLNVGVYTFQLSRAGFDDWKQQYAVYSTTVSVNVKLISNQELTRLPEEPIAFVWSNASNRFRFKSSISAGSGYYMFDLDKKTITTNAQPFGLIDEPSLRSKLGIPNRGKNSIHSVMYQSPSGRYIAFLPDKKLSTQSTIRLSLYDTKTGKAFETNAVFNEFIDDPSDPPFYLLWSPSESVVGVVRNRSQLNVFIVLKGDNTQTVFINSFKNQSQQTVYINKVFSSISDQQVVLVSGNLENQPPQTWIVNLSTMYGETIENTVPLDAVFSIDGKAVYLADKVNISRIEIASKNRSIVSTISLFDLGIQYIDVAPTIDYAFIIAGSTESPSYWIYKLPSH